MRSIAEQKALLVAVHCHPCWSDHVKLLAWAESALVYLSILRDDARHHPETSVLLQNKALTDLENLITQIEGSD